MVLYIHIYIYTYVCICRYRHARKNIMAPVVVLNQDSCPLGLPDHFPALWDRIEFACA